MNKVLVCLDGSEFSKAVCDYGIFIAKNLNLPLVLLNVIEHSKISNIVDFFFFFISKLWHNHYNFDVLQFLCHIYS